MIAAIWWRTRDAALPTGWEMRGIVKGPRQGYPRIDWPDWCACARPAREDAAHRAIAIVEGRGTDPLAALHDLRRALKELA